MKGDNPRPVKGAPFLRRLTRTPLRDLLRGRVSGRLDLTWLGVTSGLPERCAKLAVDVARRTRLRRLEKADVVRELLAHFRDGIESGADEESLFRNFGDPKLAARLIRRAKKRNRPLAWRAFTGAAKAVGVILLVSLVAYTALSIVALQGQPNPTHDYLADLNADAVADSAEDNAWPLLREAAIRLGDREAFRKAIDDRWEDDDALFGLALEHAASVELARQAASRPRLGFALGALGDPADRPLFGDAVQYRDGSISAPDDGIPSLDVLLVHLSPIRELTRLLAIDARRAAAQGDGETFLADIRAMIAMNRLVRAHPMLIVDVVGLSLIALTATTACGVLHEDSAAGLSDQELRELAHLLASVSDADLGVRTQGERAIFADVVQHTYTDDGKGDGRMVPGKFQSIVDFSSFDDTPVSLEGAEVVFAGWQSFATPSRRMIVDESDRLIRLAEEWGATPLWLRPRSPLDKEIARLQRGYISAPGWAPVILLTPAYTAAMINTEKACMARDGAIVACALELFHRREGRWPDSLGELTPDLLPSVPVDRFDGGPLKYVVLESLGPVVYSVGADRDDDGGRAPGFDGAYGHPDEAMHWLAPEEVEKIKAKPGWEARSEEYLRGGSRVRPKPKLFDGDWVLYPPIPEPPEADPDENRRRETAPE